MGKITNLWSFVINLAIIGIGFAVIFSPHDIAIFIVALLNGAVVTFKGLNKIIYYFTSARYMIGGRKIAINGIIQLDFGLLSFFALLKTPKFAVIYLLILVAIIALIDVLRAFDIKRSKGKNWRLKIIKGSILIIAVTFGFIFINTLSVSLIFFGVIFILEGISRILLSFHSGVVPYIDPDIHLERK